MNLIQTNEQEMIGGFRAFEHWVQIYVMEAKLNRNTEKIT